MLHLRNAINQTRDESKPLWEEVESLNEFQGKAYVRRTWNELVSNDPTLDVADYFIGPDVYSTSDPPIWVRCTKSGAYVCSQSDRHWKFPCNYIFFLLPNCERPYFKTNQDIGIVYFYTTNTMCTPKPTFFCSLKYTTREVEIPILLLPAPEVVTSHS